MNQLLNIIKMKHQSPNLNTIPARNGTALKLPSTNAECDTPRPSIRLGVKILDKHHQCSICTSRKYH